jgi:hypothetical protein
MENFILRLLKAIKDLIKKSPEEDINIYVMKLFMAIILALIVALVIVH